jgi:hypothetical protein
MKCTPKKDSIEHLGLNYTSILTTQMLLPTAQDDDLRVAEELMSMDEEIGEDELFSGMLSLY